MIQHRRTGRLRRALVCTATAGALLLASAASASAATVSVETTGTDSPTCGPAIDPCASVAQGIANANPGDTVAVGSGTFAEPKLAVTKPLTIDGEGIGSTTIDGQSDQTLTGTGTIQVQNAGDSVTLSDFTLQGIGQPAGGTPVGIFVKEMTDPTATDTISNVRVIGNGPGGSDYGVYCENSAAALHIDASEIRQNDFNPVLSENCSGLTVENSTIEKTAGTAVASAISAFSYGGNVVSAPQLIRNNTITGNAVSFTGGFQDLGIGQYSDIEVTGNSITTPVNAVTLTNGSANGTDGLISNAIVSGNTLTATAAAGSGVRLSGQVEDTTIQANTISGFLNGLHVRPRPADTESPDGIEAHRNRIVDNSIDILNESAATAINAQDNWFGCNDPSSCAAVTGTATTLPATVLAITANPTALPTGGGTSVITADLAHDSNGAAIPGGGVPDGTVVSFSTNSGSANPATAPTVGGVAQTTLSTTGTADVSAVLDDQTKTTTVTVAAPTPSGTTSPSGSGSSQPAPASPAPAKCPALKVFTAGEFTVIIGSPGDDCLVGGTERNRIQSGAGNDVIYGDPLPEEAGKPGSADRLFGGTGDDHIYGAAGGDVISGGSGEDHISSTGGNDRIRARDGDRDVINCGRGRDLVSADTDDVVRRNCERITRK